MGSEVGAQGEGRSLGDGRDRLDGAHMPGRAVQEVTGQMPGEEGLRGAGGRSEGPQRGGGRVRALGRREGISISCAAEVKLGPGLGHWVRQLWSLPTGPERGWLGAGRA